MNKSKNVKSTSVNNEKVMDAKERETMEAMEYFKIVGPRIIRLGNVMLDWMLEADNITKPHIRNYTYISEIYNNLGFHWFFYVEKWFGDLYGMYNYEFDFTSDRFMVEMIDIANELIEKHKKGFEDQFIYDYQYSKMSDISFKIREMKEKLLPVVASTPESEFNNEFIFEIMSDIYEKSCKGRKLKYYNEVYDCLRKVLHSEKKY